MSVYVDKPVVYHPTAYSGNQAQAARVGARNGHRWCHMWADNIEELHAFAQRIGLKRAWFQDRKKLPHYDLTPGMRRAALKAGAIEKPLVEHFRKARSTKSPASKPPSAPSAPPELK